MLYIKLLITIMGTMVKAYISSTPRLFDKAWFCRVKSSISHPFLSLDKETFYFYREWWGTVFLPLVFMLDLCSLLSCQMTCTRSCQVCQRALCTPASPVSEHKTVLLRSVRRAEDGGSSCCWSSELEWRRCSPACWALLSLSTWSLAVRCGLHCTNK